MPLRLRYWLWGPTSQEEVENWTYQLSNIRDTENHGPAGRGGNFPYAPVSSTLVGKRHWRTTSTGWGSTPWAHTVPAPASGPNQVLSNFVIKVGLPYINRWHFIAWRKRRQWPAAKVMLTHPHLRQQEVGDWCCQTLLRTRLQLEDAIIIFLQSPAAHHCAHHRGKSDANTPSGGGCAAMVLVVTEDRFIPSALTSHLLAITSTLNRALG